MMQLGCNYWASNAGTEMWRQFDEKAIDCDLKVLSENGVEYLRVFPNWRDFQPVVPLYRGGSALREHRLTDDRFPTNKYFLDEDMLDRFAQFCRIAEKYNIKLIVGLLTGFMSSRMFIPPALHDKNLFTDPLCLYFEQLFITGFVERFRDEKAIYAWDHGNECHCMGGAHNHFSAAAWARTISNAVYASDRSRPLITGIHALSLDGTCRINEQADVCDILVTHPYPYWGTHTTNDTNTYIKTTLYATAQTRLFADIGKKPCLVEEFGTMGPGICAEELAADVLRVNYFSTMANGATGLLWWCANEQDMLTSAPYSWTMVENELGMRYADGSPKPVLTEMKRLSQLKFDFALPPAHVDAVCLLTRGQDNWGVAYMTYVLAKQAGLNISFADAADGIPPADAYLLPSINGVEFLSKECYTELKERVAAGAKMYISQNVSVIAGFEALTGNKIMDSEIVPEDGAITLNGHSIRYHATRRLYMNNTRAKQVQGNPQITCADYGKGQVYFVSFPAEAMLIDKNRAFDGHVHELYREIFKEELAAHPVRLSNENVALTLHKDDDRLFAVAVNHSEQVQKLDFATELRPVKCHYGTPDACAPMDAVILEFQA